MKARFIGHRDYSEIKRTGRRFTPASSRGFTLLELIIVASITLILTAIAIPMFLGAMGSANLRGGMTSLSALVNNCRSQAIKANAPRRLRFTTVGTNGRWVAYVDDDVSDTFTTTTDLTSTMQQVWFPQQMVKVPAPTGVSPAALTAGAMWGGSDVTPPESVKDICFNSRGIPCDCPAVATTVCTAITNGYAFYFNYQSPSQWGAVGISPAGRIKTYLWSGSSWTN